MFVANYADGTRVQANEYFVKHQGLDSKDKPEIYCIDPKCGAKAWVSRGGNNGKPHFKARHLDGCYMASQEKSINLHASMSAGESISKVELKFSNMSSLTNIKKSASQGEAKENHYTKKGKSGKINLTPRELFYLGYSIGVDNVDKGYCFKFGDYCYKFSTRLIKDDRIKKMPQTKSPNFYALKAKIDSVDEITGDIDFSFCEKNISIKLKTNEQKPLFQKSIYNQLHPLNVKVGDSIAVLLWGNTAEKPSIDNRFRGENVEITPWNFDFCWFGSFFE